ncbi:hypothetical protein JB92DRAFT_2824895 [Gautieria morchelliformis]|nr:hypothetical protein JB92DRAFT_2824895 [Gautieria morchelliformis]
MQFSTSILSILAVVGVVCALGPIVPRSGGSAVPVVSVQYGSDTVIYNAGECIPLDDPTTGQPATEAAALRSVTCYADQGENCLTPALGFPIPIPQGAFAPNVFNVASMVAQSAKCFSNSLP